VQPRTPARRGQLELDDVLQILQLEPQRPMGKIERTADAGGGVLGLPDPAVATLVPYDTLDSSVPQADISKMINEKNYGFHPIFKKGRNQPAKSLNSTNWPAAQDVMYYNKFENRTAFILPVRL